MTEDKGRENGDSKGGDGDGDGGGERKAPPPNITEVMESSGGGDNSDGGNGSDGGNENSED